MYCVCRCCKSNKHTRTFPDSVITHIFSLITHWYDNASTSFLENRLKMVLVTITVRYIVKIWYVNSIFLICILNLLSPPICNLSLLHNNQNSIKIQVTSEICWQQQRLLFFSRLQQVCHKLHCHKSVTRFCKIILVLFCYVYPTLFTCSIFPPLKKGLKS